MPNTQALKEAICASLLTGAPVTLSWAEYKALYADKQARAHHLQMTLNAASAAYMRETLKQEEQTLRFQPSGEG